MRLLYHTFNKVLHDLPQYCSANVWVSASVQSVPLPFITEYEGGKFCSIDGIIFLKNAVSKVAHYLPPGWSTRLHN